MAAAFSGVGVTAIGIFLVYLTLKATRGMLGEAGRTTKAAQDAVVEAAKGTQAAVAGARAAETAAAAARDTNVIMRNAYLIEQRPWLHWKIQRSNLENKSGHIRLEAQLLFKNLGRTPALGLVYELKLYTVPHGLPPINKGHEIQASHLSAYKNNRFTLISILPNEEVVLGVASSMKITDLDTDPRNNTFNLFASFHGAYRFFDRETIGEIGTVYFVGFAGDLMTNFSLTNLTANHVHLTEGPGGRRIT